VAAIALVAVDAADASDGWMVSIQHEERKMGALRSLTFTTIPKIVANPTLDRRTRARKRRSLCSPYQRCCCWHWFMPQGGPSNLRRRWSWTPPNNLVFSPAAAHSTTAGHSGPKQGCVTAIMFPRAFGQIYARVV